ncbi:DNA cytosine methyltransferase [Nocardia pseudovaccinii]|uniref:DNA cytosine methyltransferase n=1 Tax=Nocardia pseudovaccinii TaxID=189540 RepID=UPI0007A4A870|nr:DNA (cytosine-5-)-methyltransferase [Nocardia pseudovaccinii]
MARSISLDSTPGLRVGSLFSGVGGLDLAALSLFPGAAITWHCESDPAACAVLARHWPAVPNLGDITQVDWSGVEPVDILTAGFPCQDVSAAGHRAGLGPGTRSGLWSHAAAAIESLHPQWVLIENVRGLLHARAQATVRDLEPHGNAVGDNRSQPGRRAFGVVLGDLASLGFDACWTVLRASDVGACHQRARVFILARPAPPSRRSRQTRTHR